MTQERAPTFLGNLSLFPNGIYGATNEIEQLAHQSMKKDTTAPDDYLLGVDLDITPDWPDLEEFNDSISALCNDENFQSISADTSNELDLLERNNVPSSSLKQMESHFNRFQIFLRKNNLNSDLLTVSFPILDDYLRFYYSTLKKQDGSYYSPPSLICVRAALHRYFCLNKPDVNIIGDLRFAKSNRMLKTMVSLYKKSGQPKSKSYPVIEVDDMLKIRTHFDRSSPEVLQDEIIFNLIYYFGLRGRETLPHLSKNSIVIDTTSTGKRFLRISHDIISKNAKASLKQNEYEDLKQARAYENIDNHSECPVVAWELYFLKISHCSSLFPKPTKVQSKKTIQSFSDKMCLGKNSLDNLMTKLSNKLCLSKRYTNHCIRVTLVTVLKENGFSNAEICSVTGHRNPMSVDRYNRKRRDQEFDELGAAAQRGTSSDLVSINKVSKKSRIVVSAPTAISSNADNSAMNMNIHFSGSFSNCDIKIFK